MYITSAIMQNTKRKDKPNEDYIICDYTNSIFILLDGVSRDTIDGKYPNPSPAKDVAELLGENIYRKVKAKLSDCFDFLKVIKEAVFDSNQLVASYNATKNLAFPAGAVGIISIIRNYCFYYCYIGDCSGRIIQDGNISVFTEMQTAQISQHKQEYSSYEIRHEICNNPSHPFGYGVLNGDSRAMTFLVSNSILLKTNDQILLSSDGMEPFLLRTDAKILQASTAEKILQMEMSWNNVNQDDRAIIKIVI